MSDILRVSESLSSAIDTMDMSALFSARENDVVDDKNVPNLQQYLETACSRRRRLRGSTTRVISSQSQYSQEPTASAGENAGGFLLLV